jgi:hypothetical protein
MIVPSVRQRWIDDALAAGRLAVVAALREDGAVVLRPRARCRARTPPPTTGLVRQSRPCAAVLAGSSRLVVSGEVPPPRPGPRRGRDVDQPSPRAGRPAATKPSLLVVSEAYADGWHARLDGRPVPILRANAVCARWRCPRARTRWR